MEDLKLVSLMMQYSDNNNKLITHNTMIKDLTTLNWRKSIYYTSNNVIFEISDYKREEDFDNCGTYLIDIENSPEVVKEAKDGTLLDLSFEPKLFSKNVPYIEIVFSDETMNKSYPLQYLVEEGDEIINGSAKQLHPNIYHRSYIEKFVYDVYYYIGSLFNPQKFNIDTIMENLPAWLTSENPLRMTKRYAESFFMKGEPYDEEKATKLKYEGEEIIVFDHIEIYDGETHNKINIFTKEVVMQIITAIYSESIVSSYKKTIEAGLDKRYLTSSYLVGLGTALNDIKTSATNPNGTLKILPKISMENEEIKLDFTPTFVPYQ